MKHHVKKLIEKPILAGIASSVLVITYCGVIAIFFILAGETSFAPVDGPNFFFFIFMLILFVLSAAVCGVLVFGLPVYFLIQNDIKKASLYLAAILAAIVFFLVVVANLILLAQTIK
ncbi:hypothetical protein KKC88_01800 [Patescibacteria group bacterium]|nr:hypothetical protein [Patescibacteria group bacterium]MBU1673855.1 hypothetical protein [Patescibacteria group bacterium]MBU1963232.1 hypothetical protein [Patescibacteria group bacterium]